MGRFVFGPVPSRRLGYSLGIDILAPKSCSFDCVYCQVGRTREKMIRRQRFVDPLAVVADVLDAIKRAPQVDMLTFSGSGEPTLSADLGWLIKETKRSTGLPVALITNGSLFSDQEVRKEAAQANIVLPSLDGACEEEFEKVNRPHSALRLSSIIEGLTAFRGEFHGEIWLEVMVVKGLNDSIEHLGVLRDTIGCIGPDRVQINTVTRPPAEKNARGLDQAGLQRVAETLGGGAEIICHFDKAFSGRKSTEWQTMVLNVLGRRSLTLGDMVKVTGISESRLRAYLRSMESTGVVSKERVGQSVYYVLTEKSGEDLIPVDKSAEQHLV